MTPPTDPDTPMPVTGHRPPQVDGRTADRLSAAVYVAVAVIALIGQASAAVHWIGWPLPVALPAVAGVELTAVALAARADYRRRKGETALYARVLSAAIATFMTAVNFVGHWVIGQQVAAWFFAGATATGYLVWLLNSSDRRRDQLLAEGKARRTAPDYGLWQWVRHPIITRRARGLALRNPALSWHDSLDQATAQVHRERRNRALARVLTRRLRAQLGRDMARTAVLTYDMDEIASRLSASADYDGLTDLIARDLTPAKLTGKPAKQPPRRPLPDRPEADTPAATGGGQVVSLRDASTRRKAVTSRPARADTDQADTGRAALVSVEELADTLCREHCERAGQPVPIGRPKALTTLRRVYGSCANGRAKEAKEVHAARHASTRQGADDDDLEGARWAAA